MAGNCILRPPSPLLVPLWPRSKYQKPKAHFPISCGLSENPEKSTVKEESKLKRASLDLFQLSVTLTVVSASLPKPSSAAPSVSGKKRSGRKPEVFLNPEELRKWSKELPVVSHRIAYTEILDLKRENKLKHIVKPPSAGLKQRPEVVLVVLNDNKVVRAVLPSIESDPMFWEEWDGLKIDGLCMNSYSPAVKYPDVPKPLLGFLMKIPLWMSSLVKPRPQSKRALELKRMREEYKRRKDAELARIKEERERMEKEMKMQKKMEQQQKKKKELEELNDRNLLGELRRTSARRSMVWTDMSKDSNVSLALGFLFFYIFYWTVVVNYKKQKKDYEDRLKIEKAEAEEKRRIKELEREMAGIDIGDDEEEGTKKEEDPYSVIAKQFMRSGALVRRVRSKRLPQYLERGVDVKFSDVAGLGKIRLELEEIVKFFTHGDMYRRRGVKIPGGILLCGSPGVGKTLLAKAVAGEAGVNFFSISASQFVEIYVGVGASRVRSLYQEAKENAPSVVFIDELDAVGRARGLIKGSGGQERDATLNQLLVCLDGFEGRGEVITIASTNRPDILDPALVRPGRFDRKIHIPKPGLIGRVEILQVHARKKPMAPDINYMAVAAITDGMVGAELANILEVAAINMMRDGRTEITTDDLLQAAEMQERGTVDKKERSQDMWRQMAINEAAMAVVAVNFPDLRNIEFLTISPRAGRELGYTRLKLGHVKFSKIMLSQQSILDHITVQLAPRAADELIHGVDQLSTIWAETADNARTAARRLVLGGLSDKNYGLNNFWTVQKIDDIDTQALGILHACYKRSKSILEDNMDLLHAVVHNLVEKKNLTKEEFFNLVELHGSLQPSPPTLFDIRSQKQLEHRNMLAHKTRAAAHEHV